MSMHRARNSLTVALLLVAACGDDAREDAASESSSDELRTGVPMLSAGIEARRLAHTDAETGPDRERASVHLGNAVWLARLSLWAYGNETSAKRELAARGVKPLDVRLLENGCTGAAALYVEMPGYVVLAFRGTQPNDMRDVVTDLASIKTSWEGPGLVHAGFATQFQSLWAPDCGDAPSLGALMRARKSSISNLYVTGHSLGGALATLFVARSQAETCGRDARCRREPAFATTALYTFGSPKVGNEAFAFAVAEQARARMPIYRFVHRDDLVTGVPRNIDPNDLLHQGDYRHVATKADGEHGLQVWLSRERLEIAEFVPHVTWNVADHDLVSGYLPALEQHAKARQELR